MPKVIHCLVMAWSCAALVGIAGCRAMPAHQAQLSDDWPAPSEQNSSQNRASAAPLSPDLSPLPQDYSIQWPSYDDQKWTQRLEHRSLYHRGNDDENEADESGNKNYLTAEHLIGLRVFQNQNEQRKWRAEIYYSVIVPKAIPTKASPDATWVGQTIYAAQYCLYLTGRDDQTPRVCSIKRQKDQKAPTLGALIDFDFHVEDLEDGQWSVPVDNRSLRVAQAPKPGADLSKAPKAYQWILWNVWIGAGSEWVHGDIELLPNKDIYKGDTFNSGKIPGEIRLVWSNFKDPAVWREPLALKVGSSRLVDPKNSVRPGVHSR